MQSQDVSPLLIIPASAGRRYLDLRELLRYRELLYFLTWRDIKVRYAQSLLGAAWAVLQPLLAMVIFSVFFGKLASIPSDGVPYPIFTYAALLPWMFFSNAVVQSTNSLVGNANLITKAYFPRLIIPCAAVLSGLVDFAIAFVVLLLMMPFFGVFPTGGVLWLPVLLSFAVLTSLGMGLWLSALNVQFRDIRHIVPFLVQAWLFATPVVYPSSLLAEPWRTVYGLNPMAGVVEGFRWALVGTQSPSVALIAVSGVVTAVILVSGLSYFRRVEHRFSDII